MKLSEIVGVKFGNDINILNFKNENLKVRKNLTVIANTNRGLLFGKVVSIDENLDDVDFNNGNLVRIASKKDYLRHLSNLKDADSAIIKCKKIIEELGLAMTIIDASYNFDRSQLMFRFVADSRVDFRQLARELGSLFKTRIELRQIGIRDKAKEVGGLGPCGRKLCCSSFLTDFDSVSINMAKNQSLSLNPSKINGVCGRLLCCLKYENDNYLELKKDYPNVGSNFTNDDISGKVVAVDVISGTIDIKNGNNVVKIDYASKK